MLGNGVLHGAKAVELRRARGMADRALGVHIDGAGLPVRGGLPAVAAHVRATKQGGTVERYRSGLGIVGGTEGRIPGGNPQSVQPRPRIGPVVMIQGSGSQAAVAGVAGGRGPGAIQVEMYGVTAPDVRIRRSRPAIRC